MGMMTEEEDCVEDDEDGDVDAYDVVVGGDADVVDDVSRATLGHGACISWVSCGHASSTMRGFSY